MFDIRTAADFYGKMIEDYDDFAENSSSSRHAINCATSLYHLAEWVWGDWLKDDHATWAKLGGVRDLKSFKAWVDKQEPWYAVVMDIANGSKHFVSEKRRTKSSGTYVEDGYVEPGYFERCLEVEIEARGQRQWIEAIIVLEKVAMFWEEFFRKHRPQDHLRKPLSGFTHTSD